MENSALDSMGPSEANDAMMEHYSALADAQISSNELINIAEILKNDTNEQEQNTRFSEGFWDKAKHGWNTLKNKIKHIGEIIYGGAKRLASEISNGLDTLKESFTKGKDMIVQGFKWIVEKFQELIITIIESMMRFLSRFRAIVKEKGYSVSKIEIKIPSIKFEFRNIFGIIPIPLPKIDPPDLTITIEPEKQPGQQTG